MNTPNNTPDLARRWSAILQLGNAIIYSWIGWAGAAVGVVVFGNEPNALFWGPAIGFLIGAVVGMMIIRIKEL